MSGRSHDATRPNEVDAAGRRGRAGGIPQRVRETADVNPHLWDDHCVAATGGGAERFVSRLLPLFQRRTKQVGELLPQLYLHGLALGDFELALRGLLAEGAPLSPAALERLKAQWHQEYETWKQQRFDELEVMYVWADGLYVKAGLEAGKAALLVPIGALTDGRKVVLAVESGQRESKESWSAVLRDRRTRGLKSWRRTIADGHLGSWAALAEQQPAAAEQRCWNHRIVNVLDAIPRKHHAEATPLLTALPYAETQATCERLRDQFSAGTGRWRRTPSPAYTTTGAAGRLLSIPKGPLATSAPHQCGGVAVCGSPAPHDGG